MALEQNYDDSWKYGVMAASTAHVNTASILPVIDGYQTKRGDRVLLKDQNDAKTNGIYAVNSNNLTQDTDSINANSYVNGASVRVHGGTTNINTEWYLAPIAANAYNVTNKTWITSPFGGSSSGPLVFEQTIPYAQFRTIFSNPIELLPAPGVGKVIVTTSPMILTRESGSQAYNFIALHGLVTFGICYAVSMLDNFDASPYSIFDSFWLTDSSFNRRVGVFDSLNIMKTIVAYPPSYENLPILLAVTGGDATEGDCDVKIRFEYKIIDV